MSATQEINNFSFDSFGLIIIDECHHTETDKRYKNALDNLEYRLCLGLTATPPPKSLIFGALDKIYEMTIFEAWKDGWLMCPELHTLELDFDKKAIKDALTGSKPWRDDDIEEAFLAHTAENFELLYKVALELNNCEKTVIYFPTIKLADQFSEFCSVRGVICYSFTSKTKPKLRKQYLQDFENRRDIMLANVLCLSEGIDLPSMETIIIARPTENVNLYKQIAGRVLRTCPGKQVCKICDCVATQGNMLFQHTFLTAYCAPEDCFIDGIKFSLDDTINL